MLDERKDLILSRLLALKDPPLRLLVVADGQMVMARDHPEGKPLDAWFSVTLKYAKGRAPTPRRVELYALWPGRPPRKELIARAPLHEGLPFAGEGEEVEKLERLIDSFGARPIWWVAKEALEGTSSL